MNQIITACAISYRFRLEEIGRSLEDIAVLRTGAF